MILIIYTISLGVNKETKKSIKVGVVKIYDTNLIYSRVIGLQASDRPVDIVDLLAHELTQCSPCTIHRWWRIKDSISQIYVENQHSTTVVSQESSGECRCNSH